MWVARAVVPRAVQRDALNTACAAHGTDRLRTRNVHDAAEPLRQSSQTHCAGTNASFLCGRADTFATLNELDYTLESSLDPPEP